MTEHEKGKVSQFVGDVMMSDAVYQILLQSFLKKSTSSDVNMKAAERIAIDLLNDGWKDLEKVSTVKDKIPSRTGQVGL